MKSSNVTLRVALGRFALSFVALSGSALIFSPVEVAAQTAAGTLSGQVSNAATDALLQGALVEIPSLGVQALTNNIGEYVLNGVPAGSHELVVRYTGLDPQRQTVNVVGGQRKAVNFDLTSQVYQLEQFTVSGEREGNAASITRQRNSPNVRHVVALDALGNCRGSREILTTKAT